MSIDVIDEALARFATTGPEFGPGLSNHGPMAVDALVAMGREDAVMPWAEWYARRLQDHPQARNRIAAEEWREALGEIGRAGDWDEFFRRELRERVWGDVLETWVARLAPGIMAGATHGSSGRRTQCGRSIAARISGASMSWRRRWRTGRRYTRSFQRQPRVLGERVRGFPTHWSPYRSLIQRHGPPG